MSSPGRPVPPEQPEAAATGPEILLATKLRAPGQRPGLIPRPRLGQRLDQGLGHGLVLVCAPAGYGKTVLLADWVRRSACPAAWLSLDPGDNDPARFWRHAVAALDRVRPGLSGRAGALLGPPAPASFEPLLAVLINELAAQPESAPALLVLDDYHVIRSAAVHQSVEFLMEHRPPGLCLAIASRSDPPLALARLRARGLLTEVRATELRFTGPEAAALLGQSLAGRDQLPDDVIAALASRTEGWAAGLQLAALSLRGQRDLGGFVAAFTGSHRYVLDYLTEEVLEQQDEQLRAFLLETSVLDQLSGELCDAVTGRAGGQALLERAEQSGLFLVPLDEVRHWWRYHHLFADLLRVRLQREQPERAAQLHRGAAAWYGERGLADEAIQHALAAGDLAWAARMIEQHFDEVFYQRGEQATISRWLAALPAGLVQARPRLLLARATVANAAGEVDAVEPLVEAAQQAAAGTQEPFTPTVGRAASMLANIPALIALDRSYLAQFRDDTDGTAEFAAAALAASDPAEWLLRSIAHGFLAVAEWRRGRLAAAESSFAASSAGWRAGGQPTVTAWGGYQLAQVQRAQGRPDAAVQTCRQTLDITMPGGGPPLPAAGPAHVVLGDIAYQRDDLDAALRYAADGVALCRQFVYGPPLAAGLATLAWVRQASGDPEAAMSAMTEAAQIAPGPVSPLNPVPALLARLRLAQGDLAGAERWSQESGLSPDDPPEYAREAGHLALARVLLATGQPGPALALLGRLHEAATAQDRPGSLLEISALQALALAAASEHEAALTALAAALTLACPRGLVRVFADEGAPMGVLLDQLVAARRAGQPAAGALAPGWVSRVQRALEAGRSAAPGRAGAGPAALPEPLTPRELQVLGMLAAGLSNQAIARQLVVTLDTVKKHVSHVLGKLGAANRTEAVALARDLGLISLPGAARRGPVLAHSVLARQPGHTGQTGPDRTLVPRPAGEDSTRRGTFG
ncbi:MAG TPA: LuxR C-terminal-related transcriptional regulator [Streptosporangiaceae bacterium]|nr:LuxR C-terminal-related transcriptional regulator [Streptosporangiaceae bacterium]